MTENIRNSSEEVVIMPYGKGGSDFDNLKNQNGLPKRDVMSSPRGTSD